MDPRRFPLERALFGVLALWAGWLLLGVVRFDPGDPGRPGRLVPHVRNARPPVRPFGPVNLPVPETLVDPFVPDRGAPSLRTPQLTTRNVPPPSTAAADPAPGTGRNPGTAPAPPDTGVAPEPVRIYPPGLLAEAPPPPEVIPSPPGDPGDEARFAGRLLGLSRGTGGAWTAAVRPEGWEDPLDFIELAVGMDWKFSADETFQVLEIGAESMRVRLPDGTERVLVPGGGEPGTVPRPPAASSGRNPRSGPAAGGTAAAGAGGQGGGGQGTGPTAIRRPGDGQPRQGRGGQRPGAARPGTGSGRASPPGAGRAGRPSVGDILLGIPSGPSVDA